MWELIRANKRNSIVLMTLMAIVLMLMGLAIGVWIFGAEGAWLGLLIAAGVWVFLTLLSLSSGDQILLAASGARPVTRDVHPQLFNVVEEMKIAAGLPAMPKIYIINDPAPNAFATGRNPESASVAVTAGLLGRLNRDELQGVVAHEISHILHRDILYVMLAGIMLGGIVLLSQFVTRSMYWSSMGSRRRYSDERGGNQAQIVLLVLAVLVAILAPIMAQLLYFAVSRQREYLADAGAARLTRYPEGLASALEKIAGDPSPQLASASDATAPMYIVNPFKKKGVARLSDLTSTHPPISERIRILRSMSQGVSYADYNRAFASVTHTKGIVPKTALSEPGAAIRPGNAGPADELASKPTAHRVGDIMRKVNGFAFLTCPCGLNLKLPPSFPAGPIQCPRCGRTLDASNAGANA
jgi:heat shock protein HtpX